jgi:Gas vesicle synthesis protein GvpL/GvpF
VRAGDESFERLRSAIEDLAAGEVTELLAEARAEARSRVRSMLTEAMAQAMLERAREELGRQEPASAREEPVRREPPPEPSPTSPSPAGRVGGLGWYVYCVTRADGAALGELSGVDPDHGATPLREGELTAIVSRVPLADFDEESLRGHLGDMQWLERTARRHEDVLDTVRSVRTVIPMRLCTVYRDEVGVRAMLDREAEALIAALADLDGKAEWGVKVFSLGGEAELEPASGHEAVELDAGTAYMEGRRRDHDRRRLAGRRHDAACASIHERLSAVSVDAQLTAPQRPEMSERQGEMILNGVYLVQDSGQERFHTEISALRAECEPLGLELEPSGPWPAYNFVPQTIGVAR